MIHLCFSLYDSDGIYSKHTGIAIFSVIKTTQKKLCIHLLHDTKISKCNIEKFRDVVNQYQHKIIFYPIDSIQWEKYREMAGYCSLGTFFRLHILDIIPQDIERLIYLDSDILVNLDINDLWQEKLGDKCVGARYFANESFWMVKNGLVEQNKYFNAGVLLLNLKAIRNRHDLFNESLAFFRKHPQASFADNDALNYIFYGETKEIDKKYNTFTIQRREKYEALEKCIYHYAGDNINTAEPMAFDKLFFKYWLESPWADANEFSLSFNYNFGQRNLQIKKLQSLMKRISDPNCKKIIFGVLSCLREKIIPTLTLNKERDYYVDSDRTVQGQVIDELLVHSPDDICKEKIGNFVVIIMSNNFYNEIGMGLQSVGLSENMDYFDGRLLLTSDQGGFYLNI